MNAVGLTLTDWLQRLETLSPREIDLGLERVVAVLERLALDLPTSIFHIAGTNGKGSSVVMLESLLRQTDACVGSYLSPHIIRFNERIRVNGEDATDAQIVAAFERIEAVRAAVPLTYFEYGTLAAMVVFADAGVDTAILEVGMGGRLDAVNAIEPTAGLITNISLDHCDWLGDDVEMIAIEKAGIMRKDKPVIFGAQQVPKSIVDCAESVGARLVLAGRDYELAFDQDSWSWRSPACELEGLDRPVLRGEHQLENAAAVLALIEAAGLVELLDRRVINKALASLRLDGRMQVIDLDRHWLVDVAHNPAAATVLAGALQRMPGTGKTIAIIAMLDDKDVEGVVSSLQQEIDGWIAVTADSARAISAGELARRIANATNTACLVAESLQHAIEHAKTLATTDDTILVTGSFYLVGPVLTELYSRE